MSENKNTLEGFELTSSELNASELSASELEEIVGGAFSTNGNPQLPNPGKCTKHWIRRSDTIASIALEYGVDPMTLVRINAIRDPNWIYYGQYMWIPNYRSK